MTLYRVCNLIFESNIILPELAPVIAENPTYVFQYLPAQIAVLENNEWIHQWCFPNGQVWLDIGRHKSGYLLRFAGLADFYVAPDEQAIRCYPAAGIRLETIRHLLLDQVMPLVLSHQGKLVLHASAVQTPVGAIAFVGQTGRGKSTLAAAFAAQGFPLLTDDCLLLNGSGGQLWGLPAYSGVRLWADSIRVLFEHEPIYTDVTHYSAKKRLPADNNRLPYHTQPVPIHRLYFLIPPEESAQSSEVSVTPLSAREAFMALVSYAFKLDITDHARLKAEFSMFSQFVTLPLFYHLVFPRDFSRLPVVQDAILEDLCLTS